MNEYVMPILSLIVSSGVGGYFGWFFTRRKYEAEATTNEINNGSELVKMYKEALDDLPKRFEDKYKHLADMAAEVEKLFQKKEQTLMQEIEYHKQQAEYQKKQANLYKKMYEDKNREFNKYKADHP